MATSSKGINGNYSGKVGSVVGYEVFGQGRIRSLPNRKKPATPAELANQAKMKTAMWLLGGLKNVYRYTLKTQEKRNARWLNWHNLASSHIKKNIVEGEYPDFRINYEKLLTSWGGLEAPINAKADFEDGMLSLNWDASTSPGHMSFATTVVVLFDPDTSRVFTPPEWINHRDQHQRIDLNKKRNRLKRFHLYLSFMAHDHSDASESVYLGLFNFDA